MSPIDELSPILKKLRLSGVMQPDQFRVRVGGAKNWFDVSGSLAIDEKRVLGRGQTAGGRPRPADPGRPPTYEAAGSVKEIIAPRPGPGDEADLVGRMRQVQNRVQLARRFHNDAVVQIQQIRRLALVRIFRLPGRAPMPVTFEMDDARV